MLHKTIKLVLTALVLTSSTSACAKEGYHINVQVNGVSDTISYLAYHFGDRQYLKDTVEIDSHGHFSFTGKEKLPGGIYLIVMPGNNYFEVIIDKNQHFSIKTEMQNLAGNIKFDGSPENTSFYEYISFLRKKNEEVAPIREKLRDPDVSEERREALREKSKLIDQQVKEKQEAHIENFPDCVFSLLLKSQKEVSPPPPTIMEDGSVDHSLSYHQYTKDYWKHIDFTDDRILRTPAYQAKLRHFFTNVVIQHPDSVIRIADYIINKTSENDEMFKFTLWFLTNTFERSQVMGMDAAFVHLVEEYYKTGKAFWLDDVQLDRIIVRSDRLKPLLIGKVAPDIKMYTPDKSTISLHDVQAKYTVIYFWDSECPHCKTKTPKLNDFYNRYKDHDVKVFAVNTEADRVKWLSYVEKNNLQDWINVNDATNRSRFREKYDIYSIPLMFLLDEDKKIIAKRIGVEQLEDIIRRELKM